MAIILNQNVSFPRHVFWVNNKTLKRIIIIYLFIQKIIILLTCLWSRGTFILGNTGENLKTFPT